MVILTINQREKGDKMEYKKLGKSDLKVSRIGLGTWQFGSPGWLFTDKEAMKKVLNYALDNGINFIDTAEVYGNGISETVIGEVIKERGDREELVIATKVSPSHFRYNDVLKAAKKSLERLQIDVIDLYQLHWPNNYVPVSETIKAVERLIDEGLVRYVGLSNFPPCLTREAVNSLKKYEIISNQVRYNVIERDIEKEILPTMRELGIVIIAYSPLAMGLLSGKYDENTTFPKEDYRSNHPLFANKDNYRQVLEFVNLLREIGQKYNKTVPQVVINWLLKFDDVFPIPGAKSPEHVESNIGAVGWSLSDDDWARIKEASDKLNFSYFY